MATIDLRMTNDEFAALAMAAHLEDVTLNEYVGACLTEAAKHDIERIEREQALADTEGEK